MEDGRFEGKKITDVIVELRKEESQLKIVHLPPDSLLMVLSAQGMDEIQAQEYFSELQNRIESKFNVMTFIGVGPSFQSVEQLPQVYRTAKAAEISYHRGLWKLYQPEAD